MKLEPLTSTLECNVEIWRTERDNLPTLDRAESDEWCRHSKKTTRPVGRVVLRLVGDTGLEPVTSTMSTWRSNQLS